MKKLKDYLDKKGIKYCKFAKNCGFSPAYVTSLFKGAIPNVNIAVKIEIETENEISVYDWIKDEGNICKNKKNNKKQTK